MMHLALLKNLIVILNEIDFPENNQTHFSSVAGVHHTLRFPSESHCLNNHLGQPAVEQKKTLKMFLSDPSQIITLTCHSVIPCSCWFLFKSLDLSKLFNGVVKIDRHFGISLKILSNALVSIWSLVSSGWEHVKWKMHPWMIYILWCSVCLSRKMSTF